ncbi:hypothetical protein CSC81_06245 [Tenacibaculum discolor]|uniref:Uncharacterized protein n=1 Tax=Tenacibaculum discolor TaxID=361581 RepID=A0A2G1BVD9_9FLAO|nr:hypothetical protein [Tenacibaculum discolor]MDP2540046.1 hypothetical protein [Tenacibaculum discolor]PHN98003.1 hypothetical protein CSC81_06245 [Tenacibaculum discolor]PHO01986.1 hypothetical protein CSC82_20810 [Rhodobacteraceae bacterium 4F10]
MRKKILTITTLLMFIAISVNSQSKEEVITKAVQDAKSGVRLMNDYSMSLDMVPFGYYDTAYRVAKESFSGSSGSSTNPPSSISGSGEQIGFINDGKYHNYAGSTRDLIKYLMRKL